MDNDNILLEQTGEWPTYSASMMSSYKCKICGEPADGFCDHKECVRCPKCGEEDMVMYHTVRLVFRCLNCLHRWEAKKDS